LRPPLPSAPAGNGGPAMPPVQRAVAGPRPGGGGPVPFGTPPVAPGGAAQAPSATGPGPAWPQGTGTALTAASAPGFPPVRPAVGFSQAAARAAVQPTPQVTSRAAASALPVQRRTSAPSAPVVTRRPAPSPALGTSVPVAASARSAPPASAARGAQVQRNIDMTKSTGRAPSPVRRSTGTQTSTTSSSAAAEFDVGKLTEFQVAALAERLAEPLFKRFDPRRLTPGQMDELVHRVFGPLARLLRTEFRLDRERIGKLRDSRR
jgi:hypothetical protein